MATRTVRLDDEAEAALREIRDATGLPISEALKRGLRSLGDRVKRETQRTPYDIYRELDHGPGGAPLPASTHTRRAVRAPLQKKLGRGFSSPPGHWGRFSIARMPGPIGGGKR